MVMNIYLNNENIVVDTNLSLAQLLEEKGLRNKTGIAVALNSAVVSKDKWSETQLNESDKLMIITATAGG